MNITGVDLSDWQSTVDFSALKSAGYRFAIAKATQGIGNPQSTFAHNRDTARGRELAFGALHYMSWTDDPIAQAAYFLSVYTPAKGDLPPTLDCEGDLPVDDQGNANPRVAIQKMSAWLDAVERHMGGRKCLIYADYSFFSDYLGVLRSDFGGHPWWVAAWGNIPPTDLNGSVRLWQSAEAAVTGVCNGVNPDLDQFLGDEVALRSFLLPT